MNMKNNCMWETNPEQAKLLLNPDDGFRYSQVSGEKVYWKCPYCGHIKYMMISNVNKRGLSCPVCSDGLSVPNKFMGVLLNNIGIKYIPEYIIDGKKYRYDFYLPNYNLIIEMHGRQHYEEWDKGNITLKERQIIDNNKKDYAIKNGINDYIEINCRNQSYKNMIAQIKKSSLKKYIDFNNVDWKLVCKKAMKSKLLSAIDLYSQQLSNNEIAQKLSVSRTTINRWLIEADEIGLCSYMKSNGNRFKKRPIILTNTGEIFDSLLSAEKKYNISCKNIFRCCNKESKYSGIYDGIPLVWRFLDDYNPNEIIRYDLLKINNGRGIAVSKYNNEKQYLESYATVALGLSSVGLKTTHSQFINKQTLESEVYAYGFYWYKTDNPNQPDKTKIFFA